MDDLDQLKLINSAMKVIYGGLQEETGFVDPAELIDVLSQLMAYTAIKVGNRPRFRETGDQFLEDLIKETRHLYAVCIAHNCTYDNPGDPQLNLKPDPKVRRIEAVK